MAAELDARVKDLQFKFRITTAARLCKVNALQFKQALNNFELSESLSEASKVCIFAAVVAKKKKGGTGGKISTANLQKRIKFVRAVMVRRMPVNCAWLRCTRMCAQDADKASNLPDAHTLSKTLALLKRLTGKVNTSQSNAELSDILKQLDVLKVQLETALRGVEESN